MSFNRCWEVDEVRTQERHRLEETLERDVGGGKPSRRISSVWRKERKRSFLSDS